MADPITGLFSQLGNIGFFSFLLPWLFTFAIVYGLLIKVNIFGDINKKVSGVIAIVIAFFITPYAGPGLASYFATLSTEISIVLAAILTVVLFGAMVGLTHADFGKGKRGWVIIIIAAIVIFFALGGEISGITFGSDMLVTIVFLAILVVSVWLVVSGGESKPANQTAPPGGGPAGPNV